jgi:conjugative relaxase-like TrwC/TraI family protein
LGKVSGQGASAPSGVLKIHVVRPGGHLYYVDAMVPGRAEGTGVAGEAPGTWSGAGTVGLGVSGTVGLGEFGEVLGGRDPGSGRALRAQMGDRSVSGYDLAFCSPKSVSLLHLLAPREIAVEAGAGHRAAVAEAVGYLQRAAVGVRRSRHGQVIRMAATGVVAGEFVHRTSRALDPHLHTHLVVANVAQGVDGRWSAVDGRRIFAHLRAVRGIYHARLRMELNDRLGVAWEVPPSGMGDVRGVDRRLRFLFSQRSAAMAEYVAQRPGRPDGPHRTRGAFYATRPEKDRTRTVESLTGEWKDRAADFGFELGDLTRVIGLGPTARPGQEIDPDRVRHRLEDLASHRRTLAQRDVVAVVADASPGGASARLIESVAVQVVAAAGAPRPGWEVARGSAARGSAAGRSPAGGSAADKGPAGWSPSTFEPRWTVDAVARAVGHCEGLLVPVPQLTASGEDGPSGRTGRRPPDRAVTRARGEEVARAPVDRQLGR